MESIQIVKKANVSKVVTKQTLFKFLFVLPMLMLVGGIIVDTPSQILKGLIAIGRANDVLVTDYLVVGGIGASLVNAALIMLINLWLLRKLDLKPNGIIISALFLLGGFAFMGKNIFNIWPFYLGGYCYAKYHNISYKNVIIINMLSTTLSPLSSILAQSIESHWVIALVITFGINGFIGFIMPPISSHTILAHSGYSIYNMGFAGGLIGIVAYAILELLGFEWQRNSTYLGYTPTIIWMIMITFSVILIGIGFYFNEKSFKGLKKVFQLSGRVVTDTIKQVGFGLTLINMGMLGLGAIAYVYLVGGVLNGPVLAAILTVMGFGAFGKHLRNCTPIILGVTLTAIGLKLQLDPTVLILAALFGTSLAPIAGEFGPLWGIVVGMVHLALTLNVGDMHGGLHLYNNGLSAGIIATLFIPMLDAFRREKQYET